MNGTGAVPKLLPLCSRPGFLPHGQSQPCHLLPHEKECTEAKPPALFALWQPSSGENGGQPEGWAFHPSLFLKYLIYNLDTWHFPCP